jgi:hypothetical protein
MKSFIVNLTSKHRVVIDDLNHTLQEYNPVSETRDNAQWLPLGYYSTLGGAIKRVATINGLESREYDAMEYADSVLQKAYDIIKESQK